jgi:hypothetical protein
MHKRLWITVLALVGLFAALPGAHADNWTYFMALGNNVSVSFVRVDNTTYAWKFRNDGYNTITDMKYTYSYIDADSGLSKTDADILPVPIKPGGVFGGWAAFSANTRFQPSLRITEINRQ